MVRSIANITTQLKSIVGKEIWFRTTINDFCTGIVRAVEGMDHAKIELTSFNENGERPGTDEGIVHVHANDIFLHREDLLSANYEKFQAQVNTYCKEIQTVEDLVKFCYTHRVADYGKDTDFEAQSAVRKRTMDLLGFEIDPETAEVERKLENGEDVPDEYWDRCKQ